MSYMNTPDLPQNQGKVMSGIAQTKGSCQSYYFRGIVLTSLTSSKTLAN